MESALLPDLLSKILSGVVGALLFSLAVFVHELGHFLAARWMGLTIDCFSIGFGPAIIKWRRGGVEYRLSWIPLGGYVSLPQMDPSGMTTIQGEHGAAAGEEDGEQDGEEAGEGGEPPPRQLPDVAPWRRIVVAVAGPLGNVVLAVLLAWIIFFSPAPTGGAGTTVGRVETNSPAYAAGLRPGDHIVSVSGTRVGSWNEFIIECHLAGDVSNGVALAIQRQGGEDTLRVPVLRDPDTRFVSVEGLSPKVLCLVDGVVEGSPAARAGLLAGDIIETVDGEAMADPEEMIERIGQHGERPLSVTLLRDGRRLSYKITPSFDAKENRVLIGINFGRALAMRYMPQWMQYRRPLDQLRSDARGIVRILRALFAPRTRGESGRAAGALSSPLSIMVVFWLQVQAGGSAALAFLRLLCVNLALLNLLPLPVLDGGHIMFALYETVFRRKPHPKVVNVLANVFAFLLIGLMLLMVFRDAVGLPRVFRRAARDAEAAAAPAATNAPSLPAASAP